MNEIQVLVTVNVEAEPHFVLTNKLAKQAAQDAIEKAVYQGEINGFSHKLADKVSIQVVDVETVNLPSGATTKRL